MAVKFTKSATQLLYAKRPGDTLVTYRSPFKRTKREQDALLFLLSNGFIKFLRRYSYPEVNGHGKPYTDYETHYEVLKRPEWMDQ